ncbi:MAG TPA: hypothetical protein VNL69_10180, partial [Bacteroidota bacterium]|nr:hypothetical protein [Bacteroidota bacterium]
MNNRLIAVLAGLLCLASTVTMAQNEAADDSTGLPGDNFSLESALEMFKRASTPEEFEKLLNTPDNHVNNLDLNGDGEVDYVRVVGKKNSNAHAFVLQVPVSATENQDVAVIELEKTGESSAVVQIIGDEDIYGEQKIVEPKGEGEDSGNEGDANEGGGPSAGTWATASPIVVVNVWGWPCVRYVFSPAYVVWVSPWRWAV